MNEKELSRFAFGDSHRGKILSGIEIFLIVTLIIFVASLTLYPLQTSYILAKPFEINKIDFILINIMGLFFGILAGISFGRAGFCFISWRLFPATELEINDYKEKNKLELVAYQKKSKKSSNS